MVTYMDSTQCICNGQYMWGMLNVALWAILNGAIPCGSSVWVLSGAIVWGMLNVALWAILNGANLPCGSSVWVLSGAIVCNRKDHPHGDLHGQYPQWCACGAIVGYAQCGHPEWCKFTLWFLCMGPQWCDCVGYAQ